jgi:hypothetical protein
MVYYYSHLFSFQNIFLGFLFYFILNFIRKSKVNNIADPVFQKYYSRNFNLKIILAVIYAFYYVFVVGGGDTVAYWEGAVTLNNLFWKSPAMYLEQLVNTPTPEMRMQHFDYVTGNPPGWIYREAESWFVAKIYSIISFVSFKSYIVGSLISSYIVSIASFRLFLLVESFKLHQAKYVAFATLFLPSVVFWCSGVTKDTIVLLAIIYINVNFLEWILKIPGNNKKRVLIIVFYGFLLFHIRDFMLSVIGVAFMIVLMARLANKYRKKPFAFYSLRLLTIIIAVFVFITQGSKLADSEQIKEAEVIAKDFETNTTYEGARYSIGVKNFSSTGLIVGFIPAVIAGIYRPFIWEGLTFSLICNGLESAYFFYLTWFFVKKDFFKKVKIVRQNEFLVFAFVFSILLAFMVGLTSGLLGVLVRFKAPLLSFFILVLTVEFKIDEININEEI